MKFNLPIKKSWGQNFLTDSNTIDKIINIIDPKKNETILEIGPGYGALTNKLIPICDKIYAVEIDPLLINYLSEKKLTNLYLYHEDILEWDVNILTKNYILIHLDEKWIKSLYINKYKSINPTYQDFINFLKIISQKNEILITTGLVNYNLIDDIKNNFFKKVNEKIYYKDINNKKIYLIFKPSLDDIESLIANAKTLISCHGAITHAAYSFNIPILDIIENNNKVFYHKYTSHMNKYTSIYRQNFSSIKNVLLSKLND